MSHNSEENLSIVTPQDDHSQIIQAIRDECQRREITCLHAIESGSRAWGFASPDSDYDVRLLYCHAPTWYLRLFEDKDTFEFIQDDLLDVPFDIGGWDIKKALQLIYKSNAVIFEWLHSPVVYQQSPLMAELKTLSLEYFQPLAAFHHYRGMANTASTSVDMSAPIKIKKLFYILRALLAANWVGTEQSPPPVRMSEMFDLIGVEAQKAIHELIEIKSHCAEGHKISIPPLLLATIDSLWQGIESAALTPKDTPNTAPLNAFFQRVVFNQ